MIIINRNEIIILKCIKQNNSFSIIKGLGLSYSQIALIIQNLVENGSLEYDENDIIKVTDAGIKEITSFDNKIADKEQLWIHPKYEKYTTPLNPDIIVLPSSKKLKNSI